MTDTTTGEGTTSVPSPGDDTDWRAALHHQFQTEHPGLSTEHELYAELFEDWLTEGGR